MSSAVSTKPVTVPWVKGQKGKEKLTMLTAYDYPFAKILDEVGIDLLLVGDSLGTVLYGEPNTLSVSMDDMIRHTRAVSRATSRALVIGDMPFLSYQTSLEAAVTNAGRFLKEAGAQAVKLEGGIEVVETVRTLTRVGIPVVAHIGLTPQTIHAMGTYRTHGKSEQEKNYLRESALAVTEAGAFCVVLECVEENLAAEITKSISVPTIGIGSGSNCDGQVLVTHDLIGLTVGRTPKFVAPVADLKSLVAESVQKYIARTKSKPVKDAQNALSH